ASFVQPGMSAATVLVVLWVLFAGALMVRHAFGLARLRRALAARRSVEGPLAATLARLAAAAQAPVPRLTESARLEVPVALAGEIWVPARARALPEDAQVARLAHELAHLARRDPTWRIATRALESLLFFQPLNFVAGRAHDVATELACDDAAGALG